MAEDPKTPPAASAAQLEALTSRVKTLESQVERLIKADVAGQLGGHAKRLDALEAGPKEPPAAEPSRPWRHRENGKRARILDQGNETVFEVEGGKVATLPTHEFNSLFEDATAV